MGDNNTVFSLPQPHLRRTQLCDLEDNELDPSYVSKREQLKELIGSIVKPKIVRGKTLNGKEFVLFLEQIIDALNNGDIPSSGSIVEIFNKAIIERCLVLYTERVNNLVLPVTVGILQKVHNEASDEARELFHQQHFGRRHATLSGRKLDEEMLKVFSNVILANEHQSAKSCEARFSKCEDIMDRLQVMKLPSLRKFDAEFLRCNETFQGGCIGPAKPIYTLKMSKLQMQSRAIFIKDYYTKLFNWLVAFSLVMVVVGRFVMKFFLLEIAAWLMFISLETYVRMFWSAESLHYNPAWHSVVSVWEATVYNPVFDLDRWAFPFAIFLSMATVCRHYYRRRIRGGRSMLPLCTAASSSSSKPGKTLPG